MGGTVVTILGRNLADSSAVYFGATEAGSFRATGPTAITATSPPGSGTVNVRVITPYGTSVVSSTDRFTYLPAPTVSSVSPRAGPTSGGTRVVVAGTNLTGASAVHFGATPTATFQVTSPTRITATIPAHTAGPVHVTVTTLAGTSVGSPGGVFDYLAPRVTAVSPREGPSGGGTVVTITGTDFVRGATVRFGTKSATRVTVVSATRIVAASPAHAAGAVNVTVRIPGGTSAVTSADLFRYLAP